MSVDTTKVDGRRKLQFNSLQEVLADADRLSSGPIKTLGNWSAGQIFRHLAIAYNCSIDGFTITFPWYIRLMATLFKKRFLAGTMPAGFKLSPENAREIVPGPTSTEEGLAQLRAAIERLEREPRRAPSPVFGELTREEWDQVHVAHAALHLSFLVPE